MKNYSDSAANNKEDAGAITITTNRYHFALFTPKSSQSKCKTNGANTAINNNIWNAPAQRPLRLASRLLQAFVADPFCVFM
jgi:hypothetical protein